MKKRLALLSDHQKRDEADRVRAALAVELEKAHYGFRAFDDLPGYYFVLWAAEMGSVSSVCVVPNTGQYVMLNRRFTSFCFDENSRPTIQSDRVCGNVQYLSCRGGIVLAQPERIVVVGVALAEDPYDGPWEYFDLKQYTWRRAVVGDVMSCVFEEVVSVKCLLGGFGPISCAALADMGSCVVACDGSKRAIAVWPSTSTDMTPIVLQHDARVALCCASAQFVFTVAQIVEEQHPYDSDDRSGSVYHYSVCLYRWTNPPRATPLQVSRKMTNIRASGICSVLDKVVLGLHDGYFNVYTAKFQLLQRVEGFTRTLRHVCSLGRGYFATFGEDVLRDADDHTPHGPSPFQLYEHELEMYEYPRPFLGDIVRIWYIAQQSSYSCLFVDCIGRDDKCYITAANASGIAVDADVPERLTIAWSDNMLECCQFTDEVDDDNQDNHNDVHDGQANDGDVHNGYDGTSSDDDTDESRTQARLYNEGFNRSGENSPESSD